MESSVDEQLRTTLHYDDKEKLRRKLALLQREYIKTAQRLQRAERLEAVRKHVRSRITQQNHQDQKDPEETSEPCLNPSSSSPNTTNTKAQDVLRCQGHTEGPADSGNLRRSQVIRFLLPSDAACPQTPDLSHDSSRGHRPSPALRLRSRRSRLRWERRSAEAGRTTDSSQEGQEQSKKVDEARTKGEEEEEKIKSAGTGVVNESEELLSTSESGSPSLLLTHWSTHAQTETGEVKGKEMQGDHEQREKESELRNEGKKESESTSSLLNHRNCAIRTEEDFTPNGRRKDGKEGADNVEKGGEIILHEENSNKSMEQNAAEKTENEKKHNDTTEIKEEKTGTETVDGKNGGVLDSCTLVEGLLFPVEYYVRTTRRMTFSQSQPDMQAVLLSQLSMGRPRRSRGRGRGRGLNRHTHLNTCPDQHTQTVLSSPLTTVDPHESSHVQTADASPDLTGHSESSSEISNIVSPSQTSMDALSSPPGSTPRPGRGRRRRRGRGRGRGRGGAQIPRSPLCLDTHQTVIEPTSDGHQPSSSPVSLPGPDGGKSCLTLSEPDPVSDYPEAESTHSTDDPQPSSGVDGAQCSSASEHVEKVYPIFLKSSGRESTSTRTSKSSSSWKSLLLPSSPSVQTSLLPLPSLASGLLVNKLMGFDVHQDFHLPDDQFASLKLHKLRQVTVEPGVEHLSSPSYQTHRSNGLSQPLMPLPLPLNLTPTITESQQPAAEKPAARGSTETPGEQQAENLHVTTHTTSTEPVSVVEESAADCVDQTTEQDTVTVETDSSARVNDDVVRQLNELEQPASEKHTDCPDVVEPEDDQTDKAVVKTQEEPPNSCTAVQMCKDSEGPGESPVKHLNSTTSVENKNLIKSSPHLRIHSQLLLSPRLPSAPCPFITPHPASSALLSSPTLPSLGLTPCPVAASLLLTSSPSAPALTLPPPHSPSTQALSPPPLSPCPSITSLPPSQPLVSPASQNRVPSKATDTADQHHRAEPDTHPPTLCIQSQGTAEEVGPRTEETAEHVMRPTHTLKAPAGGCLVDSCCLSGPSGDLCVAAAGKWAVCLWSQTSASDWSLIHTWTFNDPVINVFPVPDAAGLMFVTLGQLEIRELRMLSCSSFTQVLLCEGIVQAVVGVPRSRVVTSSHSATGSILQVFELSDNSSTPSSQPLVSPGVCVGALAPVDELPDALIGTDDDGHVFIWNLTSGQLLRRIDLGDGFSHTACLRGYTAHGVLFVLLQHQLLSPLEEEVEKEAKDEDEIFEEQEEEEERKRTALFSLVAVNPLSSKCVLAARLYPPKAWSGRLCEADVSSSRVVGLSQSGCVCVWELGHRGAPRMLWAPESEGWQLARWGGRDTLLTGHHNGDVTLHCDSLQTSLCH